AQPVNATPAWGAYLFVRPTPAGDAPQSWEAGRYWVDVLVGSEIRRFALHILDPTGRVPAPPPWPEIVPEGPDLPGTGPAGLPVGPFAWVAGTAVPLQADAGPPLDSASAWLDLDDVGTSEAARSFVARAYQPVAEWLGVVLPSRSTIRAASLRRLAPLPWDGEPGVTTTTTSGEDLSFVAFERAGGALWRPGVYAIRIEFEDGAGSHDLTWHVELRPGPLGAEPVLLSATRAWANLAGSTGILLGTTEPADGEPASAGVRLIVIDPEAGATYAGLGGAHLFGCGQTLVRGRPTLLGFVGPVADNLAPVTLPILTAAGSVPGLAVAAPVLTAEFGGPASYGFRAGQSPDATGYTICIGMAGSGG
ncbi:MAG: hypothetical protein HW391_753, partial [Chloroflexi bacterium]|nr:hypothetical protein [Chloroflexota bacterium]